MASMVFPYRTAQGIISRSPVYQPLRSALSDELADLFQNHHGVEPFNRRGLTALALQGTKMAKAHRKNVDALLTTAALLLAGEVSMLDNRIETVTKTQFVDRIVRGAIVRDAHETNLETDSYDDPTWQRFELAFGMLWFNYLSQTGG